MQFKLTAFYALGFLEIFKVDDPTYAKASVSKLGFTTRKIEIVIC